MENSDKERIRKFALSAGAKAIKYSAHLNVQKKEDNIDVVTQVDKEIETEFHDLICKYFPDYGFLGEEFQNYKKIKEFTWTIDPIDGTKYYANNIPLWCISIALIHNEEAIYSLIYIPYSKQLFEAEKNNGATLNGKVLKINDKPLKDSQIVWDFPSLNQLSNTEKILFYGILNKLMLKAYRVRIIGSSALSLCWLAQNMFSGYIKHSTNEKQKLDNYAGTLIASEAGAKVVKVEKNGIEKLEVACDSVIADLESFF